MLRRDFLAAAALGSAALATRLDAEPAPSGAPSAPASGPAPDVATARDDFPFAELDVAELQRRMSSGALTARALTEAYLARIAAIDVDAPGRPGLRSVIETNPEALALADAADAERARGTVRGPLHGIPVLLKDNVDTADRMLTTAGSLALVGAPAPRDATVAAQLRTAGAVLLGKTNLSEWANFRSTRSSSGWSGRGGQTRNPYAIDRTPCGSSSGSGAAIAANLAAVAVGTETDGSIVCPSAHAALVGVKPTVGLVSRAGIIPISASQDTAGPMTRTVRDAAVLLGALAARTADPRDAATREAPSRAQADYTRFLDAGALKGARIGVVRAMFGPHEGVNRFMDDALRALRDAGAVLVDPVVLPEPPALGRDEFTVLLYEFKAGLNAYLAERAQGAPQHRFPRTLAELIAFNTQEADRELRWFGQELFEQAQAKGPLTDAAYRTARARARQAAGPQGIAATLAKHRLDAMIAPTNGPAWTIDLVTGDHFGGGYSTHSAVAGWPHVTVPAGFVHGLPIGLSFFAGAWSEPRLLALAYAFEQRTKARRAPTLAATVGA